MVPWYHIWHLIAILSTWQSHEGKIINMAILKIWELRLIELKNILKSHGQEEQGQDLSIAQSLHSELLWWLR